MNPAITTQLAHTDPNAAPLTINELIDILNPLFSSVIQGSYIPYIISNSTPSMDDIDKAWIELDTAGRPLAIRTYYNGHWRRVYNGMINEVRLYSGPPGAPLWDENGRGVVGKDYDGWQICNGKNGAPDLSDRFIVAAHMNESSGWDGSSKWLLKVDGTPPVFNQTGGAASHLIVAQDLPPFNPMPLGTDAPNDVIIHGKEWKDVDTPHTTPVPIVSQNYGGATHLDASIGQYGADLSSGKVQTPIPTMPFYYALAYIIFQGYTT